MKLLTIVNQFEFISELYRRVFVIVMVFDIRTTRMKDAAS